MFIYIYIYVYTYIYTYTYYANYVQSQNTCIQHYTYNIHMYMHIYIYIYICIYVYNYIVHVYYICIYTVPKTSYYISIQHVDLTVWPTMQHVSEHCRMLVSGQPVRQNAGGRRSEDQRMSCSDLGKLNRFTLVFMIIQ